ncbi:MAG: MFS transporter [Candidatus Omnitrophica bacterium]|nr:MFS transporter [Candidatus Omnitrophota bacterium]
MARFREILRNRNFFLLWSGQIVSQFGDRFTQMALIALVAQRAAGSTFQLAKLISFTILPVFLIGPIAGVYVDRWDRKYTLAICDILRAVIIFSIPFAFLQSKSLIPIYIIIFLSFCVSRFYVPAKLSIVPDLVKEKDLLLANSLVNTTGMIAASVGFGLGGVLVEVLGVRGGFYLDSATFFVSGVMILFLSKMSGSFRPARVLKVSREVLEVIKKSVLTEIKEGIIYLINHKDIRFIMNMLFLLWAALGAIYVIIIVFIQDTLSTVTMELGFLIMFLGIGLFLGSLIYGRFGQRLSQVRTIFTCFGLGGIVLILFASLLHFFPFFIVAAILISIFGVVVAPIMTASNTLIHKVADEQMRGKIFSALEIVMHFAFLLFMLISSGIAEIIGRFCFLVSIGIIFAVIGFIGALRSKLKTV